MNNFLQELLRHIAEWEWVLLIAVIAVEIRILWNVSKERREREKLIVEMQQTRVELGRENYLSMIRDALGKAEHYVYYVSHTLTSNMTEREKDEMYSRIPHGKDKHLDHKCITGKDPGKIKYMWEQKRYGIQIRVLDYVMQSTFRFQVSDDFYAVLGFSDQGAAESQKGILINNLYFCKMLKQHFLRLWHDSIEFDTYVKELIKNSSDREGSSSLEELTREWDLNAEEVNHLKSLVQESS